MLVVVVVLAVVAAFGVFFATAFNRLRRADVGAQEALGGIDVQLTRRAELVPNLVETVKGYAAHERGVLAEVTAARTAAESAAVRGSVEDKAAADAALDRSLGRVLAVAEAYPQLRASETFVDLQRQLGQAEDQLAFARQYYNDAVGRLNTLLATVPWMVAAGAARVRPRPFYAAPPGREDPPRVAF